MRYIKPPKQLSVLWWEIGEPFPLYQVPTSGEPFGYATEDYINDYIRSEGEKEHILDARIFQSNIIKELLTRD